MGISAPGGSGVDVGFASPMTTAGDLILGGASGAATRIAKGSDSHVLTVDPSTHLPVWAAVGGGLTGWETDAEGNLVSTGGGAIMPDSMTEPITVRGLFKPDGPETFEEGVFFQIVSENVQFSSDTPAGASVFYVDEYNTAIVISQMSLRLAAPSQLRLQDDDGIGASLSGSTSSPGRGTLWAYADGGDNNDSRLVLNGTDRSVELHTMGVAQWVVSADGKLIPTIGNQVPSTPTTQQVVDKLVALGILTQAA